MFSSSLSSSSVSLSSFKEFRLLPTDVLLAGWDNKPVRLASVGAKVVRFVGEDDEEVGEEVSLVLSFAVFMTLEGLFCLS